MKNLLIGVITIIFPLWVFPQGIKIHSGTNLKGGSSETNIVIGSGKLTNNGTFTHQNSTVHFTGSTDQTIDGSSSTGFYNFIINKAGDDLMLDANISIDHELQMTSGALDLKNSVVDLGETGSIIDETATNRIKVGDVNSNTGTIQATRTINEVTDFNPGNLGVRITTSANLGRITVVRGHMVQQGTGSYTTNESIARYFQVPGIGKLESDVKVEMHYWDDELNGFIDSDLTLYQWVNESAEGWWTPLDGSVDASDNLVTPAVAPYSDYFDETWYSFDFTGMFTLGSKTEPLPVELIAFDGKCNDDLVVLAWTTASEINNEMFVVQRSVDGKNFESIDSVYGAGNSNQLMNYEFMDKKPVQNAYYRLKQVDFNGEYEYSDIINTKCTDVSELQFAVYPNPFREVLNVIVINPPDLRFSVEIYSMDSRLVKSYQFEAVADKCHKTLYLDDLMPAMYVIRIISDDIVKTYKIDKQ